PANTIYRCGHIRNHWHSGFHNRCQRTITSSIFEEGIIMPAQNILSSLAKQVRTHSAKRVATISIFIIAAFELSCSSRADQPQFDWKQVEQVIGKPGSLSPDGVYKVGLPRTDLHVKVGDVEVKPTLALGSWIAFRKLAAETIVMGVLVL